MSGSNESIGIELLKLPLFRTILSIGFDFMFFNDVKTIIINSQW